MKTLHIVKIYLDYDRPNLILTRDWIKNRIELFNQLTLKSLLNQTFKDFSIWVYCGQRNKDLTSNYPWDKSVQIIYDEAKILKQIDYDYLTITRIDSDDLMHKDAMQEVHDKTIYSKNMEKMIFKRNIVWDRNNCFIGLHYRVSPPFFTHIFPKALYKDWKFFSLNHYVKHGNAGGRLSSTLELSTHKICVVKHGINISDIKRGRTFEVATKARQEMLKEKGLILTLDPIEILKILKDFGVEKL